MFDTFRSTFVPKNECKDIIINDEIYRLILECLDFDPKKRITAEELRDITSLMLT